MNKKIINSVLIVLMFFLITVLVKQIDKSYAYSSIVYNDDGSIELGAEDIINLEENEFSRVKTLIFRNSIPEDLTENDLRKLTNIEQINLYRVGALDITKLNAIQSNKEVSLLILSSVVDLQGLSINNLTSLSIANSRIKNSKVIENFTSLKSFGYSETIGVEELDYSKFTNLESLVLSTYIDDFEELVDLIPNIKSLSLAGSNIQNKDTQYLKRLTNLKELNLSQTYLTNIDFVTSMPNLEVLSLPWAIVDLSPIYQLEHLQRLEWEAYTELFITQELVNYLDQKGVYHYDYNPNINDEIDSIIDELGLNSETTTKEAMEKISRYLVEHTDVNLEGQTGNPSSLSLIINQHKGVCYGHSIALYTIAKKLGINDIYSVSGILNNYINNYFYDPAIEDNLSRVSWGLEAHAWNYVDVDGILYGIDAAQMNNGTFTVSEDLFKANFWQNPLEDGDFDYNEADYNYYDFHYYYAHRHNEADGIIRQIPTFEFSNINGLNIVNHVIYDYDTSDRNAINLCNKVLSNYTCSYVDKDSSNSITTGDKVRILKNNILVNEFILSTESYRKPVFTHLGPLKLEYKNYPDKDINPMASSLYFNNNNPILAKVQGDDYTSSENYNFSIRVEKYDTQEVVYTNSKTVTGAQINNGISFELTSDIFDYYVDCGSWFCAPDYSIIVSVDGLERDIVFYYEEADIQTYNINIEDNEYITINPNTPIVIEENSNQELEIKPKEGYVITSIKVNDEEKIVDYKDNKITIKNISQDINIVVGVAVEEYSFIEGNNSLYIKKDLVFKVNGPLALVSKVYLNNQVLDSSNYKLESGSTIITLLNSYLNTLEKGEYILSVEYSNGSKATTKFEIKDLDNSSENTKQEKGKKKGDNPGTSDKILFLLEVLLISVIVFVYSIRVIKKLNNQY